MAKNRKAVIFPKYQELLGIMGENIKLARLRRNLTTIQVAERADIGRSTLYLIEKGDSRVSFGAIFNVLRSLGLHQDILKIAGDDLFGRKLQDLELLNKHPETTEYLPSPNKERKKKIIQTYLMIDGRGYVKIGKSENPHYRERTLQSEQPLVKLYAVGSTNIESILHERYSNKKVRGEWFNLDPEEIAELIKEHGFVQILK